MSTYVRGRVWVCVIAHKQIISQTTHAKPSLASLPVGLEVFEAEDVEDADGGPEGGRFLVDGRVHLGHDPDEEAAVDALHERVADVRGLAVAQVRHLRIQSPW